MVFSSASATAFLRDWGSTFIARMKEDRMKQMLFDTTSGHSRAKMPNVSHRPKAATVRRYIPKEISLVWRDLMIFQACGRKLAVETAAARYPRSVTANMRLYTSCPPDAAISAVGIISAAPAEQHQKHHNNQQQAHECFPSNM